jgi:ribonuclease HI
MPQPASRAWIDGAARGNPGEAGFGVHLENAGGVEELNGFLGHTTNNVAEYTALIAVLTLAKRHGLKRLTVFSDSQLLVRQVNGEYRVKAKHLQPLFFKILQLRRSIHLDIRHVRREENRDADRLANEAIDAKRALPDWIELELPSLGK